jgi:outer membrane lipoprotein SlyB
MLHSSSSNSPTAPQSKEAESLGAGSAAGAAVGGAIALGIATTSIPILFAGLIFGASVGAVAGHIVNTSFSRSRSDQHDPTSRSSS